MALKQCMGHSGAETLRGHLDISFTRFTICRWVRILATNLNLCSRAFYAQNYMRLAAFSEELRPPASERSSSF
eukprot:11011829-Alexandrium_andersonii.AAC.1